MKGSDKRTLHKLTYSVRVERLAAKLKVDFAVAMDIDYLRQLEKRIIKAARKNSKLRDFYVFNKRLEQQLNRLEK